VGLLLTFGAFQQLVDLHDKPISLFIARHSYFINQKILNLVLLECSEVGKVFPENAYLSGSRLLGGQQLLFLLQRFGCRWHCAGHLGNEALEA